MHMGDEVHRNSQEEGLYTIWKRSEEGDVIRAMTESELALEADHTCFVTNRAR